MSPFAIQLKCTEASLQTNCVVLQISKKSYLATKDRCLTTASLFRHDTICSTTYHSNNCGSKYSLNWLFEYSWTISSIPSWSHPFSKSTRWRN